MILGHFVNIDFPSQEQLANLKYYKYAAVDKSYITKYVLSHYWNWAITLCPTWIAPNLITLIGLIFMLVNVFLVAIIVPGLGTEAPSWLYFSFAAGLWIYSTLDNIDGKQARRTGTSSPLGELFDHGCDALNTTYVSLLQAAALGLGHTQLSAILFIVTAAGFYLSTAEEYYTGVLYLGYVNGPTEGIILTCLAFIWSGVYGAASWHVSLTEIWFFGWLPRGTTAAQVFVWGTVVLFFIMHFPVVFYSIYKACKEKSLDCFHAFMVTLLPMIVFCCAEYYWIASPDSIILQDEHLVLFSLATGTLFGSMASNIILAHLTRSSYPKLTGIVASVVAMAVLVNSQSVLGIRLISAQAEYVLLWLLLTAAVVYYGIWAKLVIDGFCQYLGIRCFVIRRVKPEPLIRNESEEDSLLDQEEGIVPTEAAATSLPSSSADNTYSTFRH
ncbi:hypothetical protein DFQ28_000331 [Apophysomyces sp. BC1034]|nr:hypothetical protein DFQ29_009989 [Apophysomyces sp. BC1021]KAG0191374.1 hypothetical protein DFQ28_000331 [Apophysomyces sp. BC1034]